MENTKTSNPKETKATEEEVIQFEAFLNALFYAVRISTDELHKKHLSQLAFKILQKTEHKKEPKFSLSSNS